MNLNQALDAAIDGIYTGLAAVSTAMVANGSMVMPSKMVWLSAAIAGGLGFLNQLRALRKAP